MEPDVGFRVEMRMNEENLAALAIAHQAIDRCRQEIAAAWAHLEAANESLRRRPRPAWLREYGEARAAELVAQARRQISAHRRRRARSRSLRPVAASPQARKARRQVH
jgi:hypothetical protein